MVKDKQRQSDLVAMRLPKELRDMIPEGNLSAFIKEALREKLERGKSLKTCSTCKGIGKVKRS